MSVNRVFLIGRLGRDPETRFTNGGTAVANFALATDETFKDRSGQRQKRTEWHRVVCWAKLAEIAQQYLKRGMLVYVEGRIQSREWEKDGEKQRMCEIVANSVRMLGAKDGASESTPATAEPDPEHAKKAPGKKKSGSDKRYQADDSDIPF